MNKTGLWFFVRQLPVMVAIAWLNRTNPWLAACLTAAVVFGLWYAIRTYTLHY